MLYEPREDSHLLQKHIKEYAGGIVLDMGTGSGILAKEAEKYADEVYGADIDPDVIEYCKRKHAGISFIQSDLFQSIPEMKFDLIIFNPPYLPDDKKVKDIALDGGRHGYEITKRFLDSVVPYLDGKILLLFSSLTKKDKVDEFISDNCLCFKQIDSMKLDFEELYVYLIEKSDLLKELEGKGVVDVRYMTKGHRGVIFTGYTDRKITIKSKRQSSKAMGFIENEVRFLEKLNKKAIGPKLLFSGEDYFAYEFVDGILIRDYVQKNNHEDILNILSDVFEQLHKMDKMGINKDEMHHPVKHILVSKKPVLIDFERARFTERPQNVTGFCQYIIELEKLLKEKGFNIKKDMIISLARQYRNDYDIRPILDYIK